MIDDTTSGNHFDFGVWPKCGHVKLTKLEATRDLARMLPTAYWLRGNLAAPITVGEPLRVVRYERAGKDGEPDCVDALGIFTTSEVSRVNRLSRTTAYIHTRNSIWLLEFLPALPAADRAYDNDSNL